MAEQEQVAQVARERAERKIDDALRALHDAAKQIGEGAGIPENIAGLAPAELLGRIAWVPSMARDLRRQLGTELAKHELTRVFAAGDTSPPAPTSKKIPSNVVAKIDSTPPQARAIKDLDGVSPQTAKALATAGMVTVADVQAVPDEHLLKISGVADKSLQQLRAAIAKSAA